MSVNSLKVGWFLAVRQLKRASKWTTVLIVFIMTLTFLNLVVVSGILVGLIKGSSDAYTRQYTGGVLIVPQTDQKVVESSQEIIKIAESEEGVKAVSPRYLVGGTMRADIRQNVEQGKKPNEIGVQLAGIDPEKEDQVTGLEGLMIAGEYLRNTDQDQVLVGSALLANYTRGQGPGDSTITNVDVGTRIIIKTDSFEKEVTVKGVIKSKIGEVSRRVFLPEQQLRKLLERFDLNVNEIAISLKPGHTPEETKEKLLAMGQKVRDAKVQTSEEAQGQFFKDISATFEILGNFIGAIALSVASITVFIVIFINAVTRRKYIGILKGIGIEGSAIRISYVIQSVFYAVLGSGIGYFLVFSFIKPYFDQNPIDFPFSDGILAASPEGALVRAGILFVITVIAGWLPANIIVKKNTLDSILGR